MRPSGAACLLAGLVLATLLAGCSGSGPGSSSPTAATVSPGDSRFVDLYTAPRAWAVGDWWNYSAGPSGSSRGDPISLVVRGSSGTDYDVSTDNPNTAFFDARTDISYLGAIRRADLAGSQGQTRVEYFHFPIKDNATWTTTWDGMAIKVTAHHPVNGPATFVAARPNGTTYATYDYDPVAGWFKALRFHDGAGRPAFALTLQTYGHQFAGTVVHWSLTSLYSENGTTGDTGNTLLQMPDGLGDLWLTYHVLCPPNTGGYTVVLQPLNGTVGYSANGFCSEVQFAGVVATKPAGQWLLTTAWGPTDIDYRIEVVGRTMTRESVTR